MRKKRVIILAAAALFLASLAFPYWTARMKAPNYPEKDLMLRMYAYKYDGDIDEWNRVGRLVGVRVPPPIPDTFFQLFSAAVVTVTALALLGAASRQWLAAAALSPWLIMAALTAWGQHSLYLFGHSLDPDRPLKFLQPFTPPIIGVVTLGKIQTFHYPDVGSVLFLVAGLLLLLNTGFPQRVPLFLRRKAGVASD